MMISLRSSTHCRLNTRYFKGADSIMYTPKFVNLKLQVLVHGCPQKCS